MSKQQLRSSGTRNTQPSATSPGFPIVPRSAVGGAPLAAETTCGQRDVRGISSNRPTAARRVATEVRSCLQASPYLELRNLAFDFHEGVLTLRGTVTSFYLKQVASCTVKDVVGVEVLVDRIAVTHRGSPGVGTPPHS